MHCGVAYFGSAGALSPEFEIGQVIKPSGVRLESGEVLPLNKGLPQRQHTLGWFRSIMDETATELYRMKGKGVNIIDIEGRYIGEFSREHPDMKIETTYIP